MPPPRVGIDAIHLSRQGKGLSRFQHGFLQGLATLTPACEYVVFLNGRSDLPELPRSKPFTYVKVTPPSLLVWELFSLPLLARRHRLALVQTMSDRLPLVGNTPFLLFLSEVPDYRFDLASSRGGLYDRVSNRVTRFVFPRSLRRAALVVTPSSFTRDDLLGRYPVSREKVRVVNEAADERFVPEAHPSVLTAVRSRYVAAGGYVLHFSSNSDPRDNTGMALRAFGLARTHLGAGVKLVIAGDVTRARTELESLAQEHGVRDAVVFPGYIPDEELPALYQAANVYFDPSLYEGFGLQALEAMACGAPIVCSNTTSLPELVGDAALTCAPTDTEGFAGALVRVHRERALAASLRDRGLARAKHYSWTETARQLAALHDEIIARNSEIC